MKLRISLFAALITAGFLAGCGNDGKDEKTSAKPPAIETVGTPISETEIGVPFYPGAKVNDKVATKLASVDGNALSVNLMTADAPEKITAFYREKLKAMATDKQYVETPGSDGQMALLLADEKNKDSILVNITKSAAGSDINIVVTRSKK